LYYVIETGVLYYSDVCNDLDKRCLNKNSTKYKQLRI